MAIKTYIDACVLIAAFCGEENHPATIRAWKILEDPDRDFISSEFVRLEVIPRASSQTRAAYELFFEQVTEWAQIDNELIVQAVSVSQRYSVSAMDSLHIASALRLKVDEIATMERLRKPIHAIPGLRSVFVGE